MNSDPICITTPEEYKVRILTPTELDRIIGSIIKNYHSTIFNICFWSGMRYEEVRRLHKHPEWIMWSRNAIHLNGSAQRKAKRRQFERYVPIPQQIENELKYFFTNTQPPMLATWDQNLKRWAQHAGIGTVGVSAKMTRATIETWMVTAGIDDRSICLRQGHTTITSLNHYQALPDLFTQAEKMEIKKRLSRW